MKICLLDPAKIGLANQSPNLGDLIISRAVKRELCRLFGPNIEITSLSTHVPPTRECIKQYKKADICFVGGSNLLWFRPFPPASWRFGLHGLINYRELILFGTGWGCYRILPNAYGKLVSRLMFSQKYCHSVRDEYTKDVLRKKLCVPNVLNTACPTMWILDRMKSMNQRCTRGELCVFSLTDYSKDPESDKKLIDIIKCKYGRGVIFWPQGSGDEKYVRDLGYEDKVLPRSLEHFINFLDTNPGADYIGTRLHGGILGLEYGLRVVIIAVDNRATEIAKDTNLPTVRRGDLETIKQWIDQSAIPQLRIPSQSIETWRTQFKL